jgi:oligosaccharide reducing-end xylanase
LSQPLLLTLGFLGLAGVLACASGTDDAPQSSGGSAGSTGGNATGGKATGGKANGGAGSGGATGGKAGSGGATGGKASGGAGSGGAPVTSCPGAENAGPRAACSAPACYRNLFSEVLGRSPSDVQAKMTGIVQQLFHGSGPDQRIYFELSSDSNQAFIEDIASNDVRSEGQSYGMFVAVQMNMRTEFDKLWRYAKSCMQQPSGTFAWQMHVDSCSPISTGQAPDGDEYFAEALRLAHLRWGDGGAFDYRAESLKAMAAVAAHDFRTNPAIVKFTQNANFTDASYVLPLFYSEWACFDTANRTLWQDATSYARTFFPRVIHPTTGLAPYQSNFDGSEYSPGHTFNADAWRVPMNVMSDFALNGVGTWQTGYAETHAAFWVSQGLETYGGSYSLTGTPMDSNHGAGLTGANAMLAFGLSAADATPFLQEAWDAATPTGHYRYYDGLLYALSMLYLTGTYSLFY